MRATRRVEGAVAALAVLPLLPFLDKAISLDAPVFVAVAEQVLVEPADPFGFDMVWDSSSPIGARFNRNPPLLSYWLAPWLALFGRSEAVLHAALLPFPALAALAFLGIARRLCDEPLAAAALLVTGPAFLVLSTTVLLDVPLLACMLGAVYALLRAVEDGRAAGFAVAGLLAALAGLVKYVGFSTLPLVVAGALLLAPRPARALPGLLLPPLLLWGGWGAWTAALYGEVHFLGSTDVVTGRSFEPREFWNQVASTPIWYGGALLFPIGVWLRALLGARAGLAVVALLLGVAAAWLVIPDGEPPRRVAIGAEEQVFAALACAGAVLVWAGALDPRRWRERRELFLALWLGGLAVFTSFLNWHVNAADALLAAPPALLLLLRDSRLRPSRRAALAWSALALPLSLTLAAADAVQADAYRDAARRAVAEIGARQGARFHVGQWGLHHYFAREGFQAVVPPMYGRSDLAVGDWLATARNVAQIDVDAPLSRYVLQRVAVYPRRSWIPLRTTNPDAGAGFYSHHYGYVPFAWSREDFDEVQLGRVRALRPLAPGPDLRAR